jgi:hypothetical protein
LKGRWRRPDGGSIIEIKSVDATGKMDVAYFNPQPIRVSIAEAISGVKPEYLEASFDEMQKRYGTIENYFSEGLGIDAAGQRALRDLYIKRM